MGKKPAKAKAKKRQVKAKKPESPVETPPEQVAPEKTGRKSTITPAVTSKLREVFLLDYTVEDACDHAGITSKAYYRRFKADPVFRGEMKKAQRGLFRSARHAIAIEIIEKKNARLALDLLKHREPERYRTKVETDAPFVGNITVIHPGSKPHPRLLPEPPDAEEDEDGED